MLCIVPRPVPMAGKSCVLEIVPEPPPPHMALQGLGFQQ